MQPCSYWKYDTLHVIVECGSAFFEEISKGNANFSELPHNLNTYGGNSGAPRAREARARGLSPIAK